MTAKEKIDEAEYFLNILQNVPHDYVKFYVSAFLTSARSVLDHLLEDCRIRFGLQDSKILNERTFTAKAKKAKNIPALDFIKWFRKQKKLIGQNRRYGFLLTLRNVNVHRKFPKQEFFVQAKIKNLKAGTEIPILFPPLGKPMKTKIKETEVEFTSKVFFQERPNDDIVFICKDFLEAIKALVLEAKSK